MKKYIAQKQSIDVMGECVEVNGTTSVPEDVPRFVVEKVRLVPVLMFNAY